MWRRVDIVLTDVSEERIASIFRVEDMKKSAGNQCEQVQQSAVCLTDCRKQQKPFRVADL
jgi:hypothetical protein